MGLPVPQTVWSSNLCQGPAVSCASVTVDNLLARREKSTVLRISCGFVEVTRKASTTISTIISTAELSFAIRRENILVHESFFFNKNYIIPTDFHGVKSSMKTYCIDVNIRKYTIYFIQSEQFTLNKP